jgi:hypothetical protein
MPQSVSLRVFGFLAALFVSSAVASAQFFESTLSGGYSHFYGGNAPGLFYNHDGAYIDGDFAWHLPDPESPIVAGFGVTGSGYWDSDPIYSSNINNFNGFNHDDNNLYSDFENFEIEPRLGAILWLPNTNFFVKVRFGAGLLINNYDIDQATYETSSVTINTLHHTGAAFEIHPAAQAGFNWGPTSAGLDFSYLAAWGDFGAFRSNAQELRVGAFVTFRY